MRTCSQQICAGGILAEAKSDVSPLRPSSSKLRRSGEVVQMIALSNKIGQNIQDTSHIRKFGIVSTILILKRKCKITLFQNYRTFQFRKLCMIERITDR